MNTRLTMSARKQESVAKLAASSSEACDAAEKPKAPEKQPQKKNKLGDVSSVKAPRASAPKENPAAKQDGKAAKEEQKPEETPASNGEDKKEESTELELVEQKKTLEENLRGMEENIARLQSSFDARNEEEAKLEEGEVVDQSEGQGGKEEENVEETKEDDGKALPSKLIGKKRTLEEMNNEDAEYDKTGNPDGECADKWEDCAPPAKRLRVAEKSK